MNEERRKKLAEWGRKGGKAKVQKGIHTYPPEVKQRKLREAGRKGAKISNRKQGEQL